MKNPLGTSSFQPWTSPSKHTFPLSQLQLGVSATIVAIEGLGSTKRRIMDMGLVKGTRITLTGIAPMGDPIEIELRSYRLSLRQSDAQCIFVAASEF